MVVNRYVGISKTKRSSEKIMIIEVIGDLSEFIFHFPGKSDSNHSENIKLNKKQHDETRK